MDDIDMENAPDAKSGALLLFGKATCFSVFHLFGRVSQTLSWELQS